jgi:D-glycero-alpha-D-manno-heptose-7-phosphate kinase
MRVSLIGGGSDYPEIFSNFGGFSVGLAIDWNVFVSVNSLHSSSDEKFRVGYRITESVETIDSIKHPTVKFLLQELDWEEPISINTYADVPARSGLGGSSAFIAALIKALYAFKSEEIGVQDLVDLTIRIERVLAGEAGGYQDQYMTCFGALRSYDFTKNGIGVSNQLVPKETEKAIGEALFLTPIKVTRDADYAKHTVDSVANNNNAKQATLESAKYARNFAEFLSIENDPESVIQRLGEILDISHVLKSQFTVLPAEANILIGELSSMGAIGSKLCGAGGGGFIASIVPKHLREDFLKLSARLGSTSPGISESGTQLADLRWR